MDFKECHQVLNELLFNLDHLFQRRCLSVQEQQPPVSYDDYWKNILSKTFGIQWQVIHCIDEWKKCQQRSIISGIIDLSVLDSIRHCNNVIIRIYLRFFHATATGELNPSAKDSMDYANEIEKQLRSLLQNSFLVIEQPCSSILKHDPLTIISNAKFEVKLALLLDHQTMTLDWCKSFKSIDLRLLVEEEIRLVLSQGLEAITERKPSFDIINKVEPMFNTDNEMFIISIVCNLKVNINRRGHNPKGIPVAEKKFKFMFWLTIYILNKAFVLHTFSLPVNVLSRKDYRNSYATIIWDNAFPLENRQMFETHDRVKWPDLANILNMKFRKDVGTELTAEHLDFIHTMIPNRDESNLVSWEQFAKITLPFRQFTFFEWFYKILVLVREQLACMYCNGLIHGFISSGIAEKLLRECIDGTFLIRFSESFCGAITIAYIQNRRFNKLLPWDLDRLKKMSLSHTIKCADFLLYLYPNVPKDEVFHKFYIHQEITRSITGKDYSNDVSVPTRIPSSANTFC